MGHLVGVLCCWHLLLAYHRGLLSLCFLEFSSPFGFVGFHLGIPSNLPLLFLGLLEIISIGSGGTCMSHDPEIASTLSEINLALQELSIRFQRLSLRVERLEQRQSEVPQDPLQRQHSSPAKSVATSAAFSSTSIFDTLATEIPAVPKWAVDLCASLTGSQLSKEDRALRAWEAGHWAKFVALGRVSKCRPSKPIDLQNKFYIILRAPGHECPVLCDSASSYRSVVKEFEGTISHGFPSKTEARIYCEAAGVSLPSTAYQWRPQN